MKIYQSSAAPNPRRVRIFLAEKGIEVPYEEINLMEGEHKTEGFLTKNPMGRVPVLELDDGTCISETVAICRYFEAQKPEPSLMGRDALEQALVEMWQRRMELDVFFPIAQVFRHTIAGMVKLEPVQLKDWADINRERALKVYHWLDEELANREFVAGESYTITDITLLVAVDFGRGPKVLIPDECANLKRWYGQVSSRPSAQV